MRRMPAARERDLNVVSSAETLATTTARGLSFWDGVRLVALFEWKAARLGRPSGVARLVVEPVMYALFVVAGLASTSSGLDGSAVGFLMAGVMGIQSIRLLTSVMNRWTLERKWSLAAMKLGAGVGRGSYFVGMFVTPVASFLVQCGLIAACAFALAPGQVALHVLMVPALVVCGVFWVSVACAATALIRQYETRDFVVFMVLTPLMFGAPTLYSLEGAPRLMQWVAAVNPLTAQLGLVREASAGSVSAGFVVGAVVPALVAVVVAYVTTNSMRWIAPRA